jgi:transcriptional regulator with XRE-family HTH domain
VSTSRGNVRRRVLGRRLRRMREESGYALESVAPQLYCSVSKLARVEAGQQHIDPHLVKSMLDLYDVGGDRWTETLQLAAEARKRPWWAQYRLGGDFGYVQFETDAEQVQEYAPAYVPGLLQTRDYARLLFTSGVVEWADEQLETQLEVRMIRQRRLADTADPLHFVAVVGETALRNPIGGPDVMRVQLAHMVEVAALPTVTLQVLPALSGPHASLASGFSVLSFGDLGEPDMAYVEHALGAVHLEAEPEVRLARNKFDQLRTLALGPADSLTLLREIAAAT